MDVILFGAGKNLINNWDMFFDDRHNVVAVVDNAKNKKILPNGVLVRNPETIRSCHYDAIYITLGCQKHVLEVLQQLECMGVDTKNVQFLSNGKLRRLPRIQTLPVGVRCKPYIFFEVTSMSRGDYGTGIQRTVKNFYSYVKKMYKDVIAIQYFDGFITSYEFEYQYGMIQGDYSGIEYIPDIQAGDYVFFPDTSWSLGMKDKDYDYLHNKGADLCFVLYDLTPIRKRKFVSEIHYDLFADWVKKIFIHADSVICISRAVADDLASFYEGLEFKRNRKLPLYVNYLGYDIPQVKGNARKEIKEFAIDGKIFLMVGTVQPLKNHALAVEALKLAYKHRPNIDIKILIIGKYHDLMKNFDTLISGNELLKEKILWIKDASDEEVVWSYKNCNALLYPSQAEGFGLPLVEASYFNLPILCSDIPVFREIAGGNATYFPVNDVVGMTKAILRWVDEDCCPSSRGIGRCTWRESAEGIVSILQGNEMPYRVLG